MNHNSFHDSLKIYDIQPGAMNYDKPVDYDIICRGEGDPIEIFDRWNLIGKSGYAPGDYGLFLLAPLTYEVEENELVPDLGGRFVTGAIASIPIQEFDLREKYSLGWLLCETVLDIERTFVLIRSNHYKILVDKWVIDKARKVHENDVLLKIGRMDVYGIGIKTLVGSHYS